MACSVCLFGRLVWIFGLLSIAAYSCGALAFVAHAAVRKTRLVAWLVPMVAFGSVPRHHIRPRLELWLCRFPLHALANPGRSDGPWCVQMMRGSPRRRREDSSARAAPPWVGGEPRGALAFREVEVQYPAETPARDVNTFELRRELASLVRASSLANWCASLRPWAGQGWGGVLLVLASDESRLNTRAKVR